MTLTVKQDTSRTETVGLNIVEALYNIAKSDSNTIDLEGRLYVNIAFEDAINYLNAQFSNLTITASDYYVRFKDSNAEQTCLALFQSYGLHSHLLRSTANSVTNIPANGFLNNQSISDFSDFGTIFPNCTTLNTNSFAGSLVLSFDFSNITSIGSGAFSQSSLGGVFNAPNLTGSLTYATFKGTNITSILNLGSITRIEGYASNSQYPFGNCDSLLSIVIPTTLTTIIRAFNGSKNVTHIEGEENLTTLLAPFFFSLLNEALNLANVTSLGGNCFGSKSSDKGTFGQIYLPKLTTGSSSGYYNNSVYGNGILRCVTAGLVYLRDITKLYAGDVGYASITALVINNDTSVVSLANNNDAADASVTSDQNRWNRTFSGFTGTIYVPDSMLSSYQSDAQWSSLGLTINGMSSLSHVATEEAWIQAGKPANTLIDAYM